MLCTLTDTFTHSCQLCSVADVTAMARGEAGSHPDVRMSFRVGFLLRASWLAQANVVNSLCIPFPALDFWCCLYNFNFCLLKLWDDVIFPK